MTVHTIQKNLLVYLILLFFFIGFINTYALADKLILNSYGLKHLPELEKKLSPAPFYKDKKGQSYFLGLVVDAKPAPDLKADYRTEAGRPVYTFYAFDKKGQNRSARVDISDLWVRVENNLDTLMDLRVYASNRDIVFNTKIGSRKYMTGLLNAIDPDGSLGFSNTRPTEKPEGLVEGALVNLLKQPMGTGNQMALMKNMQAAARKRLPLITQPSIYPYLDDGSPFIYIIAQARQYPVYENGFARAAFSILLLRSNLTMCNQDSMAGQNIYQQARMVYRSLTAYVRALNPGSEKIITSYQPLLPVSNQKNAEVALDILLLSHAPFLADDDPDKDSILMACVSRGDSAGKKGILRSKAVELLARLVNPKLPSRPALKEKYLQSSAFFRERLRSYLLEDRYKATMAVDAFNLGGWDEKPTIEMVEYLIDYNLARDIVRHINDSDDIQRQRARVRKAILEDRILTARRISLLAYSQNAAEANIGTAVLERIKFLRNTYPLKDTVKISSTGKKYIVPKDEAAVMVNEIWEKTANEVTAE